MPKPQALTEPIDAGAALSWLKARTDIDLIDVRSESEFLDSQIPGFRSAPILNDEERHRVGITYKNEGQNRAIEVGTELTLPHREERTQSWITGTGATKVITCWRGGLRSKTACRWIEEAESQDLTSGRVDALFQVKGGTKAMRGQLLKEFTHLEAREPFYILSGKTGSGKTSVFHALDKEDPLTKRGRNFLPIDLEKFANHKGSTFGRDWRDPQPAQTVFENRIALELFGDTRRPLVEDESICIGSVHLPQSFKQKMTQSEVILLETPLEERSRILFEEYVVEPEKSGLSKAELFEKLKTDLIRLRKRLGGLQTDSILRKLTQAFETGSPEDHGQWISDLLVHYYDRMYEYGFNRQKRKVLFSGDKKAVLEFLRSRNL